MTITEKLFKPLWTATPARPLITHYDDRAGSRVELSAATTANWAAKTANWLVDELDVEPGDEVAVVLPAHWQTAGVLLGAWWAGAHVVVTPAEAKVVFVGPDGGSAQGLTEALAGTDTVAAVSLHPLGMDLGAALPPGTVDYIADCRAHGDDFVLPPTVAGDAPALCGSTVDDVVRLAQASASSLNITTGSRVLSTRDWSLPDGVIHGFLSVLAGGGSLVQVTNPAPDRLSNKRESERTTVEL